MTRPNIPEANVLRSCLAWLAARGITAWRSNNTGVYNARRGAYVFHGTKGVPDIIGLLPPHGRLLGVECKSTTGRQSPEQRAMQARIEKDGGLYLLVRDVAELVRAVRAAEEAA